MNVIIEFPDENNVPNEEIISDVKQILKKELLSHINNDKIKEE